MIYSDDPTPPPLNCPSIKLVPSTAAHRDPSEGHPFGRPTGSDLPLPNPRLSWFGASAGQVVFARRRRPRMTLAVDSCLLVVVSRRHAGQRMMTRSKALPL